MPVWFNQVSLSPTSPQGRGASGTIDPTTGIATLDLP
jgi:hypothetical protein